MQRTQRRKVDFNSITCILVDVDCCIGCRVLVVACWMSLSVVVYRFVVVGCRVSEAGCRCQCYKASGLGQKDYLMSKKKFRGEKSFLECFTCS